MDNLPEIVFSGQIPAKKLNQLIKQGKLRKLITKTFTSNFSLTDEALIGQNWQKLIAFHFPFSLLSHRSAFEVKPINGHIYLTHNIRKIIKWPGLNLNFTIGPTANEDDYTLYDKAKISSLERACLENLSESKIINNQKRTIDQHAIEERLLQIFTLRGENELNKIRNKAKFISDEYGWHAQFKKLNAIISSILLTQDTPILKSKLLKVYRLGKPYDASRLVLFSNLINLLSNSIFEIRESKCVDAISFQNIAFFESYFSNYIEGTTFMIDEAEDIIFKNKFIQNRSQDSHDIKGTYEVCNNQKDLIRLTDDYDAFVSFLKEWHSLILQSRYNKNPGIFKLKPNRAGNTFFVDPALVEGTLEEGLQLMKQLTDPSARAYYLMYLISEVHPFEDGNGRIARVVMNAELVKHDLSKIIIPTIYRQDYILNLKRLSQKKDAFGFVKMMDTIHAYSHWLEPDNYDTLLLQLRQSNAFEEEDAILKYPYESKSLVVR